LQAEPVRRPAEMRIYVSTSGSPMPIAASRIAWTGSSWAMHPKSRISLLRVLEQILIVARDGSQQENPL